MAKLKPTFLGISLVCLFFLTFIPLKQSHAQQYLQNYQLIGQYTQNDITTILNNFGFPSILFNPEFEVNVYKVTYTTRNAQDTGTTTATGAIAIPAGITCPLPMVTYGHGTTSRRYNVPSYGSDEMLIGVVISSIYGYVSTMPDYLGMGDGPGFHPYVHAKSEATASIDLMRATRELKDSLGYNLNDQIFITGYSQGGHTAMATFKELEENYPTEFDVTAASPMSGPYDVDGEQSYYLTADAPYSTPGYLPYVVLGYQEAYGNVYTNLNQIFKSPYDTLVPQLFDGTNSINYINGFLPDTPKHMLDTAFLSDFENNPNNIARVLLADNNLYDWVPTSPLEMHYCTADEQVTYLNATFTYDTMTALGATDINAINHGNYDHGGCVQYALLGTIAFFNNYRDATGGIQLQVNTTYPSGSSTNDGTIDLVATGGPGGYSFDWTNGPAAGTSTASLDSLPLGTYNVRVSDSRGCFFYQAIDLTTILNVHQPQAEEVFQFFPNPANDWVYLRISNNTEAANIRVVDMYGQVIYQQANITTPEVRFEVSDLPQGMYIIELEQNEQRYTQKLMVR